jgi:hypothetical protein
MPSTRAPIVISLTTGQTDTIPAQCQEFMIVRATGAGVGTVWGINVYEGSSWSKSKTVGLFMPAIEVDCGTLDTLEIAYWVN